MTTLPAKPCAPRGGVKVGFKLSRQTFGNTGAAAVAAVPQVVYLGLLAVALLWLFVG